jgi:hypothetical protein
MSGDLGEVDGHGIQGERSGASKGIERERRVAAG